MLNFNSHALTFVLINAVKEQQKQIENLTAQNAEQQKEIKALKARIAAITAYSLFKFACAEIWYG